MNKNTTGRRLPLLGKKGLALAVAAALAASGFVVSAAESPADPSAASLALSDQTISLSETNGAFAMTLTVPNSSVSGDPQAWASSLTWTLERDKASAETTVVPNVYPGDLLTNWHTWGSNGGDGQPYFSLGSPKVSQNDTTTTVTVEVSTTAPFYSVGWGTGNGLLESDYYRNVHASIVGDYTLSASKDSAELAEAPMEVNIYDSYTANDEIYGKLVEIQKLAQTKGRTLKIETYGESAHGRPMYCVTLSKDEASLSEYQNLKERSETDPAAVQQEVRSGQLTDYKVPVWINNVHPDECSGMDSAMNLLRTLASDDTITYNTLTGLKDGSEVDSSLWDPKLAELGISGLGSAKLNGNKNNSALDEDASELYNISGDISYSVDDLLDDIILVCTPTENPDGRTYNTRQNGNSFDLNRDGTYQTQPETQNLMKLINKWNPAVFAEFHGFMDQFLVEPCTPPHEPNMEYDILVKNFVLGAEAFGKAGLATMSGDHSGKEYAEKFCSYYTPLRDDYSPENGWSAWDDLCTNYGPSYAMLNCGSMGYTIELPDNNEASVRLLECGSYGMFDYIMQNKKDIYLNQLEFFRRGVENIDARKDMEKWYVDMNNQPLDPDTWRTPYEETDNFFPEYYVLPLDAESQRDPADVYEMEEFLIRNGVKLKKLTEDVEIGGTVYQAGSVVVDMRQAKRNYANCVLYTGVDASDSGFPSLYSESVTNFPAMRGFDCIAITKRSAFENKTTDLAEAEAGVSQLSGVKGRAVVLKNSGVETTRAVNALLSGGKQVGMITEGEHTGDFVIDYDDFYAIRNDYALVGVGVETTPTAEVIRKPTLFITGWNADYADAKVKNGYYSEWFGGEKGYGYPQYSNTYNFSPVIFDREAYIREMGFTVTNDPAQADMIVGSMSLDTGANAGKAIEMVKSGTPYIATGFDYWNGPFRYIQDDLLKGQFAFANDGMESLHRVTYPTESLSTASYVADGDNVLYSYGCSNFTKIPDGTQILIRAADKDSHIAGCCLTESGTELDGKIEAIAYKGTNSAGDTLDLTLFGNSFDNKAHQQDDYRYTANTIYGKALSGTQMVIDLTDNTPAEPSDDPSSGPSGETPVEPSAEPSNTTTAEPSAGVAENANVATGDAAPIAVAVLLAAATGSAAVLIKKRRKH